MDESYYKRLQLHLGLAAEELTSPAPRAILQLLNSSLKWLLLLVKQAKACTLVFAEFNQLSKTPKNVIAFEDRASVTGVVLSRVRREKRHSLFSILRLALPWLFNDQAED